MSKRIPIKAAKEIAEKYGYDQVVILARKVGPKGKSWVTTYGVDKEHCEVAARMGNSIRKLEAGVYRLVGSDD